MRLSCGSLYGQRRSWGQIKYCEVLGPGEQLPEASLLIVLKRGISLVTLMPDAFGGWSIFVLSPSLRGRVPHIKPDLMSHPVSVGKLG